MNSDDDAPGALFDEPSPNLFLYRRRRRLVTSRTRAVLTILVGVAGIATALMIARTPLEAISAAGAILTFEVFFLNETTLEVDRAARTITRCYSVLGVIPWLTTHRRVVNGDYLQYFIVTIRGRLGFPHNLMIVRGRKRYPVFLIDGHDRDPILELDQTGSAVARLLAIEYRGVCDQPGFFWW
jgi:hypothetical protein